jgi:hypothetical protein
MSLIDSFFSSHETAIAKITQEQTTVSGGVVSKSWVTVLDPVDCMKYRNSGRKYVINNKLVSDFTSKCTFRYEDVSAVNFELSTRITIDNLVYAVEHYDNVGLQNEIVTLSISRVA